MAKNQQKPRRRFRRRAGRALLILLVILLLVSTLTNTLLPDRTANPEILSDTDQARAEEVFQLRRAFGDRLWPGFGQADIPLVLYNESHAFLIGYEGAPPDGRRDVPRGNHHGGPWDRVPESEIDGLPYYRRQLPPDRTPQAFTLRVGERWAASMTLRDWTVIRMGNELRDALPAPLRLIVPYRLIGRGMGSLFGTEWFISAVEHESLHAFQGQVSTQYPVGSRQSAVGSRQYRAGKCTYWGWPEVGSDCPQHPVPSIQYPVSSTQHQVFPTINPSINEQSSQGPPRILRIR